MVPGAGLLEFGTRLRPLTATPLHVTGYAEIGVRTRLGIAERGTKRDAGTASRLASSPGPLPQPDAQSC